MPSTRSAPTLTPRLLLIDVSAASLSARQTVLREVGCTVEGVLEGDAVQYERGLTHAQNGGYDLVIVNHTPPLLDGVLVGSRLRESEAMTPLILICVSPELFGLTRETTGADGIIQKGAHEVTQLLRAVRRLLERRQMRKPPVGAGTAIKPAYKKRAV